MDEPVFPIGDSDFDQTYAEEAAMVDASELIAAAMDYQKLTRADLARLLDVRPSEVTARLAGERNITVRTLAATLHSLGWTLRLSAAPTTATDASRLVYELQELPAQPFVPVDMDAWRPIARLGASA